MKRSAPKRKLGRYKKPLRRVSTKRAKINRQAAPWREEFKREIGCCEICKTPAAVLDCHEITGGWARKYVMTERACILVLCRSCHNEVELSPKLWTVARQAAVLRRNREQDFCLATLNRFLVRQLSLGEIVAVRLYK